MLTRSICALGIACAATGALAQDAADAPPVDAAKTPSDLEKAIVVVAKRYASPAGRVTAAVSSWDADDVERRQTTHVSDLLQEAPGAYVLQDGPRGQIARVFTRGAASTQTLVVIDGIPQNDATTGGVYDFNDLGAHGIESVELLRGSYGVLYGSEAIGGVVDVRTRRGEGPPSGFVRVEGGSFSTHREVAGFGFADGDTDLAATFGNYHADGERSREDFDSRDAALRLGVQLEPGSRLEGTFRWVDSKVQSPFDFASTGVLPEDDDIDRRRETYSTGLAYLADVADWLSVRLHGSLLDVDSHFDNGPDGPSDPRDELRSRASETDWRGRVEATAWLGELLDWRPPEDGGCELEVTAGGAYLDQDSLSVVTFPDFGVPTSTTTRIHRTTHTRSLFGQGELHLPESEAFTTSTLSVGGRLDDHSVFGTESSPFFGARTTFAPTRSTLRASYGEGFRAPQPVELDDPFVGNVDLGAETSRGWDVGLIQEAWGGRLAFGVTYFRLQVDDLIAYDAADVTADRPFGRLTNFAETETRGWEYFTDMDLGRGFSARGSLTIQNPRDRDTGLNLQNRAKHFGSAGVAWEGHGWRASLDGFFSGANPDQGGEVTYPEPSARRHPGRRKLVNLSVSWQTTDRLRLFGRIENLLDDDWVATPTSPAGTPLGVFVGVELEF